MLRTILYYTNLLTLNIIVDSSSNNETQDTVVDIGETVPQEEEMILPVGNEVDDGEEATLVDTDDDNTDVDEDVAAVPNNWKSFPTIQSSSTSIPVDKIIDIENVRCNFCFLLSYSYNMLNNILSFYTDMIYFLYYFKEKMITNEYYLNIII